MTHSLHVEPFLDPQTETYSYVLADFDNQVAVVIDPVLNFDASSGCTSTEHAEKIVHFLNKHHLTAEWILETHAHADHLSASQFLQQQTQAKIGIGEHICQVQEVFKTLFHLEPDFATDGSQFDRLFRDGETLVVGQITIRILHTPGHTPADVAYIVNETMVFVGDTLFMPDVGTARCDFPKGDSQQLYRSIQSLFALPDETELYMCHDYPTKGRDHHYVTTVLEERKNNIHVGQGSSEDSFVAMRTQRDRQLQMPKLILPSIQVNIRAGKFPPAEENGISYLKIPLNQF